MASIAFPGFDRIITDPAILEGRPCIRGMRLSVGRVLAILALQPSGEDLRAGSGRHQASSCLCGAQC